MHGWSCSWGRVMASGRFDYIIVGGGSSGCVVASRAPVVPQARVLGGGSAVNAMVYIRGQAADYDGWDAALGGAGWSYRDLLPYFIRQEGNDHLGKPWHGVDGPLKVSHLGQHSAASRAFVQAM